MTYERSEFVTNAYKYSAIVANFERMSNLFIRKHIRKHIRLCVRAALQFKYPSPSLYYGRNDALKSHRIDAASRHNHPLSLI